MGKVLTSLLSVFKSKPTGELSLLTESMDNVLITLNEDINLLPSEYSILTATGQWLDIWGSWFRTPRLLNETDEQYSSRLSTIVTKPKVTIPALMAIVQEYINDPTFEVKIYEPHTNVRKFNKSKWGSRDRFKDSVYYSSGVIDISVPSTVTPGLQQVVDQAKSAGVAVFYSARSELTKSSFQYNCIFVDSVQIPGTADELLYLGLMADSELDTSPLRAAVVRVIDDAYMLPLSFPLAFTSVTLTD